ncbi:hypothetical protein LSTR_LSTR012437 [Laodelphax striatellus]|uniref:Uncharacterized protein n=1 Tax=Laodelphax striatellus TaxID=195883 RepID=A0A482WEM9_LAOST|nr:hypothetical protein LSTR_LSTR012437 [Laodelphax striatellus]
MDNNTIIEGTVKFRDGKKWKSRWCVMRKLSPVADCVHLQLYRDSRDRYKQGQTKASLSLQHFLALETGFTLDKESNTMAIICQDVTVVLAFDTRERLIQWQVKIANNLGEDQQFLIQIVSAPPRAKIATGPARMHVQEHRFCLTTGFPPRLIGCWEISQLRRYGAVEKRFCFEGGSRCGRGEGVYVLATDQCDEISRTLEVAAQGKLATRRRPVTRNLSVMESPRRQLHSRAESDQESCVCPSGWTPSDSLPWPSSETTTDVSDFGDAISMEYADTHSQSWQSERGLGRCVSCISKLGAPLSRSSTANTPGECRIPPSGPSSFVSFPSCESTTSTEYSTPRGMSMTDSWMMHAHRHSSSTPIPDDTKRAFSPPARPPKPGHLPLSAFHTPPAKRTQMPMPFACSCQHNAYNNYDVPRSIVSIKEDLRTPTYQPPGEYYDTPRSLRDSLQRPTSSLCHTPISHCCSRQVQQRPNMICPCQRIVCCRESWMMPYNRCCSPDNSSEIPIQKARLSGTGKMPVNSNGNLAIYATVDKLKRLNCKETVNNGSVHQVQSEEMNNAESIKQEAPHTAEPSANYVNVEPVTQTSEQDKPVLNLKEKGNSDSQSTNANNVNYMNLDFAQSLQYYENAKDLRRKAGLDSETYSLPENSNHSLCSKCGHSSQAINLNTSSGQSEDYLLMEPATSFHTPPVADSACNSPIKSSETVFNPSVRQYKESAWLPEKSSSVPSLAEAKQEVIQKRETEFPRIADNMSRVCQSQSAASSPYLRRHKMSYCQEDLRFRRATSVESSRNSEDSDNFKSVISRQSVCDSELSVKSVSETKNIELQIVEDGRDTNKTEKTDSASHQDNSESTDTSDSLSSVVNIRRSSSVPCKSVNRDSSSSNDSGVSTGSLNQRGTDFAEFELPMSGRRHHLSLRPANSSCLHSSLPRKSKSSDPLQELTFQFQKDITPKSSSAEAEVPVCSVKRNILKGFTSPDRPMVFNGVIDTHSTSSGTSDMSDYCETLSLSSYCSDTSELLRFNHQAVTTLRPRSGKEYQKIDRSILESDIKLQIIKCQILDPILSNREQERSRLFDYSSPRNGEVQSGGEENGSSEGYKTLSESTNSQWERTEDSQSDQTPHKLQLKPAHRPLAVRAKWPALLAKYAHATESRQRRDEPVLSFQRNVFFPRISDQRIKDAKVVELLYHEARYNILEGRYPCEVNNYIMLGAIQARLELGPYNPQHHTIHFFREQHCNFLPVHMRRGVWTSWFHFSGKTSPEVKLLEQFKLIPANTSERKLQRKYLEFCWSLPYYGCAFFQGQVEQPVRGLTSLITHQDVPVLVGINTQGVYIIDNVQCCLLLGLKYEDMSWDFAKPSQEDNPDCLPCLFLQFRVLENGTRVFKILQVFSKQAVMMDALISGFVEDLKRKASAALNSDEPDRPSEAATDSDDTQMPLTKQDLPQACLGNKLSKLTLATFDEEEIDMTSLNFNSLRPNIYSLD